MCIRDSLLGGGTGLGLLLGLIQVSPIPVKPWSAIAKALERAINGEVLKEVGETKAKDVYKRQSWPRWGIPLPRTEGTRMNNPYPINPENLLRTLPEVLRLSLIHI